MEFGSTLTRKHEAPYKHRRAFSILLFEIYQNIDYNAIAAATVNYSLRLNSVDADADTVMSGVSTEEHSEVESDTSYDIPMSESSAEESSREGSPESECSDGKYPAEELTMHIILADALQYLQAMAY